MDMAVPPWRQQQSYKTAAQVGVTVFSQDLWQQVLKQMFSCPTKTRTLQSIYKVSALKSN